MQQGIVKSLIGLGHQKSDATNSQWDNIGKNVLFVPM